MEQDQRLTSIPKTGDIRNINLNEYPPAYSAYFDEGVGEGRRTIQQYFNIVYKRLPLILALTVLVTIVVAFYMWRQPTEWQSSMEMLIEPRKPRVTSKDAININFGNDVNYYNTQIQLLSNNDLMQEVVKELGLYKDPNLFAESSRGLGSIFTSVFAKAEEPQPTAALPVISESDVALGRETPVVTLTPEEEERVREYARRFSLSASQRERTNLVGVTVRTNHQKLAPIVANKAAEIFKRKDSERETLGMKRAAADLASSIEELQNTINTQEAELISKRKSSGLALAEKGEDLAASRLGQMSDTWLKALEARRQLEGRYNAALSASQRGQASNLPDLYENKIYQDTVRLNTERRAKLQDDIRAIDKQISEAETEKAKLLARYTPEYIAVKEIEQRIIALRENKLSTEKEVSTIIDRDQRKIERDAVGGALASLKSQLDAKRREEVQAQAAYEREAAISNEQGQAQTQLTSLKQQIDTNRNLLGTYTQRLKEQELAIQSEAPDNIKIASEAVGASAVGPKRTRNVVVAMLLALAAGIGLAFLLDYLDDSVKSSEDISRHLGLPTLALIPHYFGSEKRRLRLAAASAAPTGANSSLVTLEERHSPMAEAYRHLRTSLLFSSAGKPPQTILVTSSQPSEGKTTTAINTAVTLAQAETDVVIIDCDLRRPRLHGHFGMENTTGLTNYLSGERKTENLIKTYPGLPRLKVITSGPIPPNPAELLSSNEMKNLLQFLRGRYKHIVIDSPPAISFTDAAILSTLVDGVVLVAMSGKSSMHLMRRFKQRLANMGARIYGVVLNGIKSGSVEYEYYGSAYYDYYKSDGDSSTPVMEETAPYTQHRD
jgi:succinoglycan biosynthesis transport protein ExoP